MIKSSFVLSVAFATALTALGQSTAREILDRYVEVTGSAAAYRKVQNQTIKAKVVVAATEDEFDLSSFVTRAGEQITILDRSTGSQTYGVSKGLAWEETAFSGARILDGPEKDYYMRQEGLFYFALSRFDQMENAGTERIGDAECDKIVVHPKGGEPETRWYDHATGFLIKATQYAFWNGRPRAFETSLNDYRKDGEIIAPHKVVIVQSGITTEYRIEKILYDQPIPAGVFDPPSSVVKLAAAVKRGTALPNARLIVERAQEAAGDLEAQKAIKTQLYRGKMVIPVAGLSGPLTMYLSSTGETYQVIEIPGAGKIEAANNGDVEWERSTLTGPKIRRVGAKPGDFLNPNAGMSSPTLATYTRVETVAVEDVKGKKCYKVNHWSRGGLAKQTIWYAQDTGLPAQMTADAGETSAHISFSDYRTVDHVKLPFLLETEMLGQKIQIAIDEIKLNEPFPKEASELPEEIAKLVQKRTTPEVKELQPIRIARRCNARRSHNGTKQAITNAYKI